jgi:hypothetical protein
VKREDDPLEVEAKQRIASILQDPRLARHGIVAQTPAGELLQRLGAEPIQELRRWQRHELHTRASG